jgi:3-hydroxyacyl-[acyl-carrier-protein] dehydratase
MPAPCGTLSLNRKMNTQPPFELNDLLSILPHRPPFLFVDRVVQLKPYKRIVAERTLRPDEPQFAGHFPDQAIMPGVLVAEALAQTSGLLIGLSDTVTSLKPPALPKMFMLASNHMKYTHPAVPNDVLVLRATAEQSFGMIHRFSVEAAVGRRQIAHGTLILARIKG